MPLYFLSRTLAPGKSHLLILASIGGEYPMHWDAQLSFGTMKLIQQQVKRNNSKLFTPSESMLRHFCRGYEYYATLWWQKFPIRVFPECYRWRSANGLDVSSLHSISASGDFFLDSSRGDTSLRDLAPFVIYSTNFGGLLNLRTQSRLASALLGLSLCSWVLNSEK